MQKRPTSAYIHIPFCPQICYYCDFSKVFIKNQPVDEYLAALMEEVKYYDLPALRTLYIGGGTPSALSAEQLDYLLTNLETLLDLSQIEEFTIEANPGDLTPDKIAVLAKSKCNRVSSGVQTFDDRMLKKIGRSHNQEQIYETIAALKAADFHNISIDLIYALSGQTMEQVEGNVARALALDIPHMSLYSLILENHTVFMNRQRRGNLHLPNEDVESDMFDYILQELEKNGFEHYEISNFTKPGFESRHNLMYWDNSEYYGLGAGASGYLTGMRYRNRGPIQHYLKSVREKGHARLHEEMLSLKEQMEEEMFLGLRKKTGISKARFKEKFGLTFDERYGQIVSDLKTEGLLQEEGDVVRMTKKVSFLGLRYKETVIIPFDMVDMTHQIKLSNFISYCLVVSGRQSASLGRSDIEIFEAYGVVWVVTDYELNINRLPLYNERVTIETEALSYNKFFCYRKFFIYDESGDLLLDILCYFVLIDFETRQLVPVPDDLVAPYQSEKIKKVHRAPKLATLNEPNVQEYHVRYFDIDMNGHVNNGKYFEWMYDVLDVEFLTHHVPTKIALKYVKEVSPGGTIESQHFLDMAELVSHHAIVAEGQVRAQARMEWRKENGRNG